MARQIADCRQARIRNAQNASMRKRISLEDLYAALKETRQLNLIIKGDNSGTVEALEEALMKIEVDDDISLRVIHRGVGGITKSDIDLALRDDVIVLGFNVRAEGQATELANREGVDVRALDWSSTRRSTRSRPRSRACSSPSTRRSSSARRRSARSSGCRWHRHVAGSLVRSGNDRPATRRRGSCVTVPLWSPTT